MPDQSIGLIQNLQLVITDQIDGGCWTNIDEIRQKTRLILERAGIAVYLEPILDIPPFTQKLHLDALGMRVSSSQCFAHLEVSISALDRHENGPITFFNTIQNHSDASIFVSPKKLDSQILQFVETTVSRFAADAISARRDEIVQSLNEFKGKVPVKKWSEIYSNEK